MANQLTNKPSFITRVKTPLPFHLEQNSETYMTHKIHFSKFILGRMPPTARMQKNSSARGGPLTRSKSAGTNLLVVSSLDNVDPAVLREKRAKRLFLKLARQWRDAKPLDPNNLATMDSYADIMTSQKLQDWYYIAGRGCYYDIELEYGRVIFNQRETKLYYYTLSSTFQMDFTYQMETHKREFSALGKAGNVLFYFEDMY